MSPLAANGDTVVLQSFRSWDVPAWIERALQSVRGWANARGYDYRFQDDTFLARAPDWARWRLRTQMPAVTDLARLAWAREVLFSGARRVIWIDADCLLFDPDRLELPQDAGHACARELHLFIHPDGSTEPRYGINNAVLMFEEGDDFLDRYLAAALDAARTAVAANMPHTLLGPTLLRRLDAEAPLPLIEGIGVFGPALMEAIAAGGTALTREYLRHMRCAPVAANLGHSLRQLHLPPQRVALDAVFGMAVERLLSTRGSVLAGCHSTGDGVSGARSF